MYRSLILALLLLFLVDTLESFPLTPTVTTSEEDSSGQSTGTVPPVPTNGFIRPNAEISYFWHQKGKDLLPLWPLESPGTSTINGDPNRRDRLILIHQINDEAQGEGVRNNGFTQGIRNDPNNKNQDENNNNIFVFCLMVLFGLIICGLIWCLCTVSRHEVDNNGDNYRASTRMNSRFSRRRAGIEVIMPYSTDLPPSYDDIVADFEKLGAQCILPSYVDIMTKKVSSGSRQASVSPPPRYTSPTGSFSAQGSGSDSSPNSPSGARRSS